MHSKQHYFILLSFLVALLSCSTTPTTKPGQDSTTQTSTANTSGDTTVHSNDTSRWRQNVRSIFQDKNNNYWFGTDGQGLYRYDGKAITLYSVLDGLSGNQIQSIQEDETGKLWFGTGGFSVTCFDGKKFTTVLDARGAASSMPVEKKWSTTSGSLFFYAGGGVYRHTAASMEYWPLPISDFDNKYVEGSQLNLSAYSVYCTLQDRLGNLWMGTQTMGVCCYRPNAQAGEKTFTWITEKQLSGPAVRALFEDSRGNLWFGNNGGGVFRYDPMTKVLTNLTQEKGLTNEAFFKTNQSGPQTLARVWSVNEDDLGTIWIGTIDAGLWRYDGETLTQYTTSDGLPSNEVNTIYKDKTGILWIGTALGVCSFHAPTSKNAKPIFTQFSAHQ